MQIKPGQKIAVIMPAFNEEQTIAQVISGVKTAVPGADVIVIIDNTTDQTAQVARAAGATVLKLPLKLGMGCAIQTGYKYVLRNHYDFVVRMDSDGQHLPGEIDKLLQPVLKGEVDVSIGSRYQGQDHCRTPLVRRAMMVILAKVISLVYGKRFTDTTSGFNAGNRKAIKLLAHNYPTICGTPTLILLKWAGLRVAEVSVAMKERQGGVSYFTSMRKLAYVLRVLVALLTLVVKKKSFEI
ncbi:glycosyltransferase family 2 protein [Candidatus Omnitrophota bacterium]